MIISVQIWDREGVRRGYVVIADNGRLHTTQARNEATQFKSVELFLLRNVLEKDYADVKVEKP